MKIQSGGNMPFTRMPHHRRVSDDEIISGFTSLQDAIQRGFARLEGRITFRLDALDARVSEIERGAPDVKRLAVG